MLQRTTTPPLPAHICHATQEAKKESIYKYGLFAGGLGTIVWAAYPPADRQPGRQG